jgi:hypothetical protein
MHSRTQWVPPVVAAGAASLLALWLSACTAFQSESLGSLLKSSESCYTPILARSTPAGPVDGRTSQVPLLHKTPPGSGVLGSFKINADFGLILEALQYNARRVGADAVVIQKLTWWDINHWEDPKTFTRTKVVPVSDSEKEEYEQKLKEYEAKKSEGKPARKPCRPKDSRSEETVSMSGHWNVSGGAYLEALMVEYPPR